MFSILSVNLNNINLHNINNINFHFDEDVSETIIHVRVMAWRNRFNQRKAFKKRYKQIINACSMASNKMVGLVHIRIREERNRTNFY